MYGRLVIDPGFVYEGKLRGIVLGNEEVPGRNPKINEEVEVFSYHILHCKARTDSEFRFQELKYYVEQLKEMHGPLSYYRTTDLRFKEEQGMAFHMCQYAHGLTPSPFGCSR